MNRGRFGLPTLMSPYGQVIQHIVTQGTQAEVFFENIPPEFAHLLVMVKARGTVSALAELVRVQINRDAGSNYDDFIENRFGIAGSNATTSGQIGAFNAATSNAGLCGHGTALFLNYRDGFRKTAMTEYAINQQDTAASTVVGTGFIGWRGTAPIHCLRVFFASGNFADGSTLSLYGIN